jgi:hypothetical protein
MIGSIGVACDLLMHCGAITTQAAGNLADAKPHLHQAAQAASVLKVKVRILPSHGDPGHSRCAIWVANQSLKIELPNGHELHEHGGHSVVTNQQA